MGDLQNRQALIFMLVYALCGAVTTFCVSYFRLTDDENSNMNDSSASFVLGVIWPLVVMLGALAGLFWLGTTLANAGTAARDHADERKRKANR